MGQEDDPRIDITGCTVKMCIIFGRLQQKSTEYKVRAYCGYTQGHGVENITF